MAIATAFTPINMNNWTIWYGDVTIADSTHIRVVSGGRVQDYVGSFSYDAAYENLTGGTVTGMTYTLNGVQQYSMTGMSHSALHINNLQQDGNGQALVAYLFSGSDVMNGSSGADIGNGYGGNDTINGNGGNDKINGGAGSDVINGGTGNDTITWGNGDTINGAGGTDTLRVTGASLDLTTAANSNNKLLNLEQIDLRSGAHTLTLNSSDVLDMSPKDSIKILGDGADTVNIAGTQSAGTILSNGFTRYTIGGATLTIDSDVNVM